MSSVRWRTAAAPAVRHHCDTSEPARWRSAATPAARHPTTPQRWLKVFSQATTGGHLRRHGVGSRFPLNMEPGTGRMPVAFSLAWLKPSLELLQTGIDLPRKARGGLCQHQGGAGERPPFSTLRARPNEHPSIRCARVSSWLQLTMSGHRAGFRRQWQRQGHSHSKPNKLFSCKLSMKQRLSKGGPCKLPR